MSDHSYNIASSSLVGYVIPLSVFVTILVNKHHKVTTMTVEFLWIDMCHSWSQLSLLAAVLMKSCSYILLQPFAVLWGTFGGNPPRDPIESRNKRDAWEKEKGWGVQKIIVKEEEWVREGYL